MDHAAGHHVAAAQYTEFDKLAAIEIDAAAGIDLGLLVGRKMVAETWRWRYERAGSRHAARDRRLGHRRLHHRLAFSHETAGRTWRATSHADRRVQSPHRFAKA
jgi:hypothetical protein